MGTDSFGFGREGRVDSAKPCDSTNTIVSKAIEIDRFIRERIAS